MKNRSTEVSTENVKMDTNKFIESIRKRMDSIPGLTIDNFGLSAHLGKKFSPGCKACKQNKWVVLFMGKACNAQCYFCPQPHNKPHVGSKADPYGVIVTNVEPQQAYYEYLLIKLKNAATRKAIEAIGYGGGEAFLYLESIKKYAKELTAIKSGLYQYVYTNGIAVTEDNVKALRDVGIQEIRFNLAATDYSEKIIKKMEFARKIMPFLTIEVPSLKDSCRKIKKSIQRFIDIGVDQINLSELLINEHNAQYFYNEPYYDVAVLSLDGIKTYKIIRSRIDALINKYPTWSRHATYDIIEIAAEEKWPITINDCSQLNHDKSELITL